MSIRAVIFDVYKTILQVDPAPTDAEDRWVELLRRTVGKVTLSLGQFGQRCREVVDYQHIVARQQGIAFPEIFWLDVTRQALADLQALSVESLDDFLFEHAQLVRSVTLMPGAADTLKDLSARGLPLGIASNAQPYTLRELEGALANSALSRALFDPGLQFWSFESGFSKPDPHVFRWLTARLRLRGFLPPEVLMVGDRLDNDIQPARAAGWQTWQICPSAVRPGEGDWRALQSWLSGRAASDPSAR